ncbi:hypothetical protein PVAP13_7KG024629 [Panicum virgatum]|uniref:Uncharacterized protein n=1 Tax=Panicum virgatum TaxID=38727 RepID=A0A8T0QCP8_PANVG|nr:hypothetical protein PVAP13_7KG024629 [Panicum virgatum]
MMMAHRVVALGAGRAEDGSRARGQAGDDDAAALVDDVCLGRGVARAREGASSTMARLGRGLGSTCSGRGTAARLRWGCQNDDVREMLLDEAATPTLDKRTKRWIHQQNHNRSI